MTSQTFLKLTTLLSAFIFLSGVVAMEPQKRSMNAIYAEIRDNQARYSNTYKYDAIDLMRSRKANNFANTVSILEQMADNIPNYNQEDVRNLLSLIQSYEEELYTNELIGLNLFGTLAKHKDILCQIQARCSAKLNAPNEAAAQDIIPEPEITQKSRSSRKSPENAPVEKKLDLEAVDTLTEKLQKKINVIARARILGDLQQQNVPIAESPESLNKATNIWSEELVKALKKAIEAKNEKLVNRLWQANFNDNHAHFKAREKELYGKIVQRLEKDNIDESDIKWFSGPVAKLVYKKEAEFALKSKPKPSVDTPTMAEKSADGPAKPTTAKAKPEINATVQGIMAALRQLKNAHADDAIMAALQKLSDIQIADAITPGESIVLKNDIGKTMNHVYQNCMLGLYGDNTQKIQLNIFDMCADRLIAFGTRLRTQLKEPNIEIDTYVNNALKQKQAFLYEIKVIRDAEKIATEQDVATWKTIMQGKLSADIEQQNADAIQKTIDANFDASKNPLLAENHAHIVQNVKNMFNGGKDKANSAWINNHAKNFTPSQGNAGQGIPNEPAAPNNPAEPNIPNGPAAPNMPNNGPAKQSFCQTCKDHYVLSSLALITVIAGAYCLWEEYCTEDDSTDKEKPAEKEESKKEEPAAADKEQPTTNKKNKANTPKQTKTA